MGKEKGQMSVEEIVKMAAEAGGKAAVEEYKKTVEEARQQVRNKRVHNTKKLLENYRKLKAHIEEVEDNIETITHDMFMTQHYFGELVIPSILKSKQHTLGIVRFIDCVLEFYKGKCKYGTPEDKRRSEVLFMHYIDGEPMSIKVIAEKLNIAERTCYDDLKLAREELAVYLFGVDVLDFKEVG